VNKYAGVVVGALSMHPFQVTDAVNHFITADAWLIWSV